MDVNKVSEAARAVFAKVNQDLAQRHIANILSDLGSDAGANVAQYVTDWKSVQGDEAPEEFAALIAVVSE